MKYKIKQARNFHLILFDIPSGLILSLKNRGDGFFLLSNNLFLKKAYTVLQKTVTEYNYISNIIVAEKVNIIKTNKIYQHKKGNIYD